MERYAVVVAGGTDADTDAFEATLADQDGIRSDPDGSPRDPEDTAADPRGTTADDTVAVTVRALPDIAELYDVLTKSVVGCLVLPASVDGTDAGRIVSGIRGLYPDLPVVVAGEPAEPIPDDIDVTVVDAEAATDEAVADAVRSALAGGVHSDAARPPSRMETMLLSMLDQFPVHLYAKDGAARHVITSSTNQSPLELAGLTDLEYTELPEDHRRAAYNDDLSVLEGDGKRVEVEEYTDFIDSHTLTTKVPWYGADDDVIGLVGLTRDITERKKREQASRRQHELLVKVALVAAHELRNELQVAAGRLELLEEDGEHVETIADAQRRLVDIIDKVVELASAERPERTREGLWLSTLAREVWDTLDPADAELHIVEDLHFVADRESTSLFLGILFRNAVQHGGPAVTVTVGATERGLSVADDGDGVDATPPERVFDAGYTTDSDSTGFGLYVARSIADEHGWQLELGESAEGGARFDVVGPLDDERPVSHERVADGERSAAGGEPTVADGDGTAAGEDDGA